MVEQARRGAQTKRDDYQDVRNRYEGGINGGKAKPQRVAAKPSKFPKVEHPGAVESLIPVWGSGKEAIADWQDGDYVGAVVNGAIAASDVVPVATLGKTAVKATGALVKVAGKHTTQEVRDWMIQNGYRSARDLGVERHHWLIPNKGWGKNVPDYIKNQPWNLHEMDPVTHQRLHRKWKGQPRFGPIERTYLGTPAWARASVGSVGGKIGEGVRERTFREEE